MFDFFIGGLNGDGFGDGFGDEEWYPDSPNDWYPPGGKNNFEKDKWYYHKKVKIKVIKETKEAYLLKDKKGQYWCPKKLIHLNKKKTSGKQYRDFNIKYLGLCFHKRKLENKRTS